MSVSGEVLAQFTSNERRIASLVTRGLRNKDIALQMGLTTDAIKQRMVDIFDKSGTWSRLELALWWLHHQ